MQVQWGQPGTQTTRASQHAGREPRTCSLGLVSRPMTLRGSGTVSSSATVTPASWMWGREAERSLSSCTSQGQDLQPVCLLLSTANCTA